MNVRSDIQYGQTFGTNLLDENGSFVDLNGSVTVVFQYRTECGTIVDVLATIVFADTGQVSVSGIPVGSYNYRWKVIHAGDPDPIPGPVLPTDAVLYGNGNPNGVQIGGFLGQMYIDLDTLGIYVFGGVPGTDTGWA